MTSDFSDTTSDFAELLFRVTVLMLDFNGMASDLKMLTTENTFTTSEIQCLLPKINGKTAANGGIPAGMQGLHLEMVFILSKRQKLGLIDFASKSEA